MYVHLRKRLNRLVLSLILKQLFQNQLWKSKKLVSILRFKQSSLMFCHPNQEKFSKVTHKRETVCHTHWFDCKEFIFWKFSKRRKNCYLRTLTIASSRILNNRKNSISILSSARPIPSRTLRVSSLLNNLPPNNQQRNHPFHQASLPRFPQLYQKKLQKFQFQEFWTKLTNIRTLLLLQNELLLGLDNSS